MSGHTGRELSFEHIGVYNNDLSNKPSGDYIGAGGGADEQLNKLSAQQPYWKEFGYHILPHVLHTGLSNYTNEGSVPFWSNVHVSSLETHRPVFLEV